MKMEKVYKIHDNGSVFKIRARSDSQEFVHLTVDEHSYRQYGDVDIALPIPLARLLGQALVECCDEMERSS